MEYMEMHVITVPNRPVAGDERKRPEQLFGFRHGELSSYLQGLLHREEPVIGGYSIGERNGVYEVRVAVHPEQSDHVPELVAFVRGYGGSIEKRPDAVTKRDPVTSE